MGHEMTGLGNQDNHTINDNSHIFKARLWIIKAHLLSKTVYAKTIKKQVSKGYPFISPLEALQAGLQVHSNEAKTNPSL